MSGYGRSDDSGRSRASSNIGMAVIALLVFGAIFGIAAWLQFDKTDGGQIAVVRNGGPFDNNNIRQVIQPASSLTWTGWWSSTHKYPAQQRFYTITADPNAGDKTGVDVEQIPTSDGVEVGIQGTVYFTLNRDPATLKSFDNKYGTRTYKVTSGTGADATTEFKTAWEDEAGFSAFLDQIIRPVISNDLRQQIGSFPCGELQASCALVQNGNNPQAVAAVSGKSNFNIAKIQNSVNKSLQDDFNTTLGGPFITDVRFNLAKITLPDAVQTAINKAQAAFAAVAESRAKVQQASADAAANAQRQLGYKNCPACVTIDTLKAIPPNVTTFAPGAGFGITSK